MARTRFATVEARCFGSLDSTLHLLCLDNDG